MWKFAALAFVCTALAVTPIALAQTQGNSTPSQTITPIPTAQPASCTPLRSVLDWHQWQTRNPAAGVNVCSSPDNGRLMDWWRLYRRYREVTPYRCQSGKYGTWAIPCYVIACESHFSWAAANSSGAVGPYQLLGWGAPYPARTFAEKVRNHEIAHSLSLSNWVCA